MTIPGRALVVGLGNPMRADDGLGPAVIEALGRRSASDGVDLVVSDQDGPALLELWAGRPLAVVVDAVRSAGNPPGTLHRFTGNQLAGRSMGTGPTTTHRVGLGATLDLAEALGRLPERLVVHGVEVVDLGRGRGLSPPVAAAVEPLVDRIVLELGRDAP